LHAGRERETLAPPRDSVLPRRDSVLLRFAAA
jgi:hypothetical protein